MHKKLLKIKLLDTNLNKTNHTQNYKHTWVLHMVLLWVKLLKHNHQVVAYYFGSSAGSKAKDEAINRIKSK